MKKRRPDWSQEKWIFRGIGFVRSLNPEMALLLFLVASGFAFVLAATALPLLTGQEPVQHQQRGKAGGACNPPKDSASSALPCNSNNRSEVEEKRQANADNGGGPVSPKGNQRFKDILFGTTGMLASAAFFFLALGTALSAIGANRTRQSSRAHVLPQHTVGADGGPAFVVRNLGPTLALLRGYRFLPVPENFDPYQFERCGASTLEPLHHTVEMGKTIDLPFDPEASKSELPCLLVEVAFKDVFHVAHRSWRLFSRDQKTGYEAGEDGELPAWWSV